MRLEVEELKTLKEVNQDLLDVVNANLEEFNKNRDDEKDPLEKFEFHLENIGFAFINRYESSWEDQGKYQYQESIGQLVAWDLNKAKYPCDKSIVERYNLFGTVNCSRSGSYFSEYYYNYDEIHLFKYEIKHVEEIVVPAHDTVVKKTLDNYK
jgi:hypothetical protein